jgi:hypothetical protein
MEARFCPHDLRWFFELGRRFRDWGRLRDDPGARPGVGLFGA